MEYTVQKLSQLAGVTPRTLRYYDSIGLLSPCRINSSGYRIYGPREVDLLQQILFYRELGLELEDIKKLIYSSDFDLLTALYSHKKALMEKQYQLMAMLHTVEKTIEKEEGARIMSDKEKFEGLKTQLVKENRDLYQEELLEKYGDEKVRESEKIFMNLSKGDYEKMESLGKEICSLLEEAVQANAQPDSEAGLAIAQKHRQWLSFTWPSYSLEAHIGLGEMYVADERFTRYYDQNVAGCAQFLRDAICAMGGK